MSARQSTNSVKIIKLTRGRLPTIYVDLARTRSSRKKITSYRRFAIYQISTTGVVHRSQREIL